MPVVHEREDGELYIKSRMPDHKYCTWQVSPVGEKILYSFGLADDKTKISRYSLFLLKKNKLIYTNNTGFSNSLNNERLTETQKHKMDSRERKFIHEVRRRGDDARGTFSRDEKSKPLPEKVLPKVRAVKDPPKEKHEGPNFRIIDRDLCLCLVCSVTFSRKGIVAHLKKIHQTIPVIEPEKIIEYEENPIKKSENKNDMPLIKNKEGANYRESELEQGIFECLVCQKQFAGKAVERHLWDEHQMLPIKVEQRISSSVVWKKRPDGWRKCPICGIRLRKLSRHLRKVHPDWEKDKNQPSPKTPSLKGLKKEFDANDFQADGQKDHVFEIRGSGSYFKVFNIITGELISEHIGENAKRNAQIKLDELNKKFNI